MQDGLVIAVSLCHDCQQWHISLHVGSHDVFCATSAVNTAPCSFDFASVCSNAVVFNLGYAYHRGYAKTS